MSEIRYEFVIVSDDEPLDPIEVDNVLARAADYISESFDTPPASCYFERDA